MKNHQFKGISFLFAFLFTLTFNAQDCQFFSASYEEMGDKGNGMCHFAVSLRFDVTNCDPVYGQMDVHIEDQFGATVFDHTFDNRGGLCSGELNFPVFSDCISDLTLTTLYYHTGGATGCELIADPVFIALPIEIDEFAGIKDEKELVFSWTTYAEVDSDVFILEQSSDGISFDRIHMEEAAGFSLEKKRYQVKIENTFTGIQYFRLKMMDLNGAYTYSNTVTLDLRKGDTFISYHNPESDIVTINISDRTNQDLESNVLDQLGRVVASGMLFQGDTSLEIPVQNLSTGIYYVAVENAGTKKIFVH
ncbi:MAG: T9SS type A sorting domain-containing protein [Saprospiraceae bacterium]|nr:T9SS type A sorting domain-containing protein [Saprospiraceae bacterium]